jgi:hypothetical protein
MVALRIGQAIEFLLEPGMTERKTTNLTPDEEHRKNLGTHMKKHGFGSIEPVICENKSDTGPFSAMTSMTFHDFKWSRPSSLRFGQRSAHCAPPATD